MTKRKLYTNKGAANYHARPKPKVEAELFKAFKTVSDQEAFYFYEDIGKPTGLNARNIHDFLEKVKTVKTESLLFHLQRRDFQNWVEKILGDTKLAREIGRINTSNGQDVKMIMTETIQNRIKELQEPVASTGLLVADNSMVLMPTE
jgi:hypothetical protein